MTVAVHADRAPAQAASAREDAGGVRPPLSHPPQHQPRQSHGARCGRHTCHLLPEAGIQAAAAQCGWCHDSGQDGAHRDHLSSKSLAELTEHICTAFGHERHNGNICMFDGQRKNTRRSKSTCCFLARAAIVIMNADVSCYCQYSASRPMTQCHLRTDVIHLVMYVQLYLHEVTSRSV